VTTLLLVNPVAGHGRGRRLASEASRAIERTWGAVERIDTTGPGTATAAAREAAARVERIVVLGGDGTLHEAANGILQLPVDQRPPITIIPAGTGNDYARMIGTRGLTPARAVERLSHGTLRRHDVGYAWDEYFINSIGVGFDAAVARRMQQTSWGRGMMAYLVAVIRTMAEFRSYDATVVIDGEQFAETLLLVEVAIGYSVGGGFRLTPDARLDDGLLDLCAIRHLSIPAILAKLPLAMLGRHTRLAQVRMRRGASVTITPRTGHLLVQFDGELRDRPGAIDIRLLPGALPVLCAH
jgi:YegS/Rv2252/BmrU family lipid kinase